MRSLVPSVEILGVPVARLDRGGALAEIERLHREGAPATVFYANAHSLNLASRDDRFRGALRDAALVLNDGSGVSLGARLEGTSFPDNLNGSDFNPEILGLAARRGWPVYFLGAAPRVADEAAARLMQRIPNLRVAGTHAGFFAEDDLPRIVAGIRASGAEVVLVAMGNPLQEQWLARHLTDTGARLGVGVGAFFDFAAGRVPRAPTWMSRFGIEWVFRLYQEPRRMWRRYVLGNPLFVARILKERARRWQTKPR